MSEDNRNSPITYTLKAGKGYEASWAVFYGDSAGIRQHTLEFFGIDPNEVEGLSAADVMLVAQEILQGGHVAIDTLGGKPVSKKSETAWSSDNSSAGWYGTADTPKDAAQGESAPERDAKIDTLLASVAATTTVDALRTLWAKNKEAFNNAELMDAYKNRARS